MKRFVILLLMSLLIIFPVLGFALTIKNAFGQVNGSADDFETAINTVISFTVKVVFPVFIGFVAYAHRIALSQFLVQLSNRITNFSFGDAEVTLDPVQQLEEAD